MKPNIDIIPYSKWSDREYPAHNLAEHVPYSYIIHHSGMKVNNAYDDMKGFQKYHITEKNFVEIGYHYVIFPSGLIFEGRKIRHKGAHCYPNSGKIGICIAGNYEKSKMTSASITSLTRLLAYLSLETGISLDNTTGHKDHNNTLCPGKNLYDMLSTIIYNAKKLKEL